MAKLVPNQTNKETHTDIDKYRRIEAQFRIKKQTDTTATQKVVLN